MPRVPKGEYAGKSSVFSTRIKPDLRKALEKAAKQSGRSLSQEIEHRLRRSFIEDDKIADAFGDRETYRLMRMLADAVHFAERSSSPKQRWLDDPVTFQTAINAMAAMLRAVAPEDTAPNPYVDKNLRDKVAWLGASFFAYDLWQRVRNADAEISVHRASSGEAAKDSIARRDLSRIVGRTEWMTKDDLFLHALERQLDLLSNELAQEKARLVKNIDSLEGG